MIGHYHPGRSLLHRAPAGPKLAAMLLAIIATVLIGQVWQLAAAAASVVALYGLAGIPGRAAWAQLRPMRWFLVVIAAVQFVLAGPERAVLVCGGLLVTVALAALVTLTTTVTAMLDVCQAVLRPLRRVGVDPDRVGLLLALTIRCVPLVAGIVGEVGQARKARGVGFSVRAMVAPAVVRALRTADALGDALIARGVDD